MVHMAQEFNLAKGPLGINPVIKCVPYLLYRNLFFRLRIRRTTETSNDQNLDKQIETKKMEALEMNPPY